MPSRPKRTLQERITEEGYKVATKSTQRSTPGKQVSKTTRGPQTQTQADDEGIDITFRIPLSGSC